jgi:pullulanase/glycogen debranching enzyme
MPTLAGRSFPIGAAVEPGGVNFCVYSRTATAIDRLLFDAADAATLTNYWEYQPIGWFAPQRAYSSRTDPIGPVDEFRDMVKALHRAHIEVILDVVFNRTAEDDESGPTLSLRGLVNPTYYLLDPENPARYVDDTGCHNTINGNETITRRMTSTACATGYSTCMSMGSASIWLRFCRVAMMVYHSKIRRSSGTSRPIRFWRTRRSLLK